MHGLDAHYPLNSKYPPPSLSSVSNKSVSQDLHREPDTTARSARKHARVHRPVALVFALLRANRGGSPLHSMSARQRELCQSVRASVSSPLIFCRANLITVVAALLFLVGFCSPLIGICVAEKKKKYISVSTKKKQNKQQQLPHPQKTNKQKTTTTKTK